MTPGRLGRRHTASLDELESRLVWIFGSPRSGSTWLLELLVHPLMLSDESPLGVERRDAPDAGEPHVLPINEPYIPQHLAPALPDELVLNDALPAVTLHALRSGSSNYFLSDRYSEVWRPELRGLVLARLRAQYDRIVARYSLDRPVVAVKEPNGSLGADFTMSLFPRARLVFLLRDGRDVVDSMVDAQTPGGWLASKDASLSAQERLALVRREASLWLARTRAVQRAYDAHPAELRCVVRYEDLRAAPASQLAELDRWLGLRRDERTRSSAIRWTDFDAYPPEAKGRGLPLRAARPGLWRENLTPAEQDAMSDLLGAKLAELGYNDDV
jgi:Sulfotransferase family